MLHWLLIQEVGASFITRIQLSGCPFFGETSFRTDSTSISAAPGNPCIPASWRRCKTVCVDNPVTSAIPSISIGKKQSRSIVGWRSRNSLIRSMYQLNSRDGYDSSLHQDTRTTNRFEFVNSVVNFLIRLRVRFFMARRSIEGTKLAVDCADVGIIDVSVNKVSNLVRRVVEIPPMMCCSHQLVYRCIIVKFNALFNGQTKRFVRRTNLVKRILPSHTATSKTTNDSFNIINCFRTRNRKDIRISICYEYVILNSNSYVRISFWTINIGPPGSKIESGSTVRTMPSSSKRGVPSGL